MPKRTKLWKSISVISLAGVTGLSGCAGNTEHEGELAKAQHEVESIDPDTILGGEGESGGEGEGEGEGSSSTDLATDDLAYLNQLGLMRGHLYVGYKLYLAGHIDHAKTHMKHPESELYADVVPAFKARGVEGFAEELSALAESVEQEKGKEQVTQAYEGLITAIAKSGSAVSTASATPVENLKLIVELLRVAGEEYAIAVVDGKMQNAHEYQDALGFTTIAGEVLNRITSDKAGVIAAKSATSKILADLEGHWPALIPPETLSTEAGAIYAAASKIELLALGLE